MKNAKTKRHNPKKLANRSKKTEKNWHPRALSLAATQANQWGKNMFLTLNLNIKTARKINENLSI